jgi:hypothetical protein
MMDEIYSRHHRAAFTCWPIHRKVSLMRFSTAYVGELKACSTPNNNHTAVMQIDATSEAALPCKAQFWTSLENAALGYLGLSPGTAVDWSPTTPCAAKKGVKANGTIDWAGLLAFLEQLLPILLPLI